MSNSEGREFNSESSRNSFRKLIEESFQKSHSRLVLALDFKFREDTAGLVNDAKSVIAATSEFVCAYKFNFHLLLPLSADNVREINDEIQKMGKVAIADIKLNDIDNTNAVATEYLWRSGFSAVIVNPFVGYRGGLDVVLKRGKELGKGVITLAYMSHEGADESYGLEITTGKSMFHIFLERANFWKVDGVIVGSTRLEKIAEARSKLDRNIKIFSPGSGAQGGNLSKSVKAGSDYLIMGRSIIESGNVREAAKQAFLSLASSETR